VPPPADLNEPLLTPAEAALPVPPGASRTTHSTPHRDHTVGKKKVSKTAGTKRVPKHVRKQHVDKAGEGVAKKGATKRKSLPKDEAAKKKGDKRQPQGKTVARASKGLKKPVKKAAASVARRPLASGAHGLKGPAKATTQSGKQPKPAAGKHKNQTGRQRPAPSAV